MVYGDVTISGPYPNIMVYGDVVVYVVYNDYYYTYLYLYLAPFHYCS